MAIPQSNKFESRILGFNESEFGGDAEEANVDQALASFEAPAEEQQPEADPELSDVDLRLETADYYRAILNHKFFDVSSPAAQVVDREIRSFIRERLEVLLGLRAPRSEAAGYELPFSDEQVEALQAVADRVIGVKGPQVKKMPTPGTPKPEVRPAVRAKPVVKKIPAPPQAPSTKPKARPSPLTQTPTTPVQPVAAKPQAQKPVIQHEPGVEGGISQTYIDLKGNKITLVEGEIIEEEGRKYQVVANGAGTLYRRDISGQAIPTNRIPPMSVQQISAMSQHYAEQQLGQLDEMTGMAVVHSIANKE